MSDWFDWQTDGSGGWEDPSTPRGSKKNITSRRNLLFASIAFLIIAGIAAVGFVGFLKMRVDNTTARLKDEVLGSHELLLQAIRSNDFDLFETILPTRYISWHDLQYELLRRRLVLDRASFGLRSQDDSNDKEFTITFGPELKTAELTEPLSYTVELSGSMTQTVELEQVFQYQQIQNSWQYAPPADEDLFWGKWLYEDGQYLELIFPQRDAEIGNRLAPMLDSLLSELCGDPSIACPKDFHLIMKLSRFPRSLFRLGESKYATQLGSGYGNYTFFLPAPSLIGKPIDEDGFQALFRGYAGWMASVVIANYYQEGALIDDRFLADRLARWELKPPPLPDPIFPRTVHTELPSGVDPPKQDVLMLCSGDQKIGIWRYVPTSNKWLDELNKIETAELDRFTSDLSPFGEAMLARLPNQRGILIMMRQVIDSQPRFRTYLWQDSELKMLLDEEQPYYFIPTIWLSRFTQYGHHGILFRPRSSNWDDGSDPWWFDYDQCIVGRCELRDSGGYPIWSPGGTRSLILQMEFSEETWLFIRNNQMGDLEQPALFLGDNAGNVIGEVGYGYPVAWLDEDHFSFLRPVPGMSDSSSDKSGGEELVIAAVSGENNRIEIVQTIVNSAQLAQAIAAKFRVDELKIISALPAPEGYDGWFIEFMTFDDGEQPARYIVWYHPQMNSVGFLFKLEGDQVFPMTINPQGGHLLFASSGENGFRLQIFDVAEQDFKIYGDSIPYDWSDNGKWLLFVETGQLRAVDLENGFELLIPHDLSRCYSAVWTERRSTAVD